MDFAQLCDILRSDAGLGQNGGVATSLPGGPTRYAQTVDGCSIAYQVFGSGPLDIVVLPGITSHVEIDWELPGTAHFYERLGTVGRVAVFDKRGTGMSDHGHGAASLEERVDDIRAVMDAVGMERAAIFGISEGGAMAVLFAATEPARVTHLMLHGCLAVGALANEQLDAARKRDVAERILADIADHWGDGTLGFQKYNPAAQEMLARAERYSASPSTAVELMRMHLGADVRPVLGSVRAPTLVTHCVSDPIIPFWQARELAERIPGATLVGIDADWHTSMAVEDMALIADTIEKFLTGTVASTASSERVLTTMLFTDIAGSTAMAVARGDAEWRKLLDSHDAIVQREVATFRGEVAKHTGDGILATFDGPGRAIQCARAIRRELAQRGIVIRAGLHTGEVEQRRGELSGVAVHLAARVQQAAADGEIWVSPTVPGLVAGSGIEFAARGRHVLKGIPGDHELAAVG